MKRIYKTATFSQDMAGYTILLDGRQVKTPQKAVLTLPTEPLAKAIADEWAGQVETIIPDRMPLTRFANTALDRVVPTPDPVIAEITSFGETDQVCYRAEYPRELVELQDRNWRPLLEWIEGRYGVALRVGTGIIHQPQPEDALIALRDAVAAHDPFALPALHTLTTISGSLVLGLAVSEGRIDARTAFDLGQLDETFQAELWGLDAEAEARRDRLRTEMEAAGKFLSFLAA